MAIYYVSKDPVTYPSTDFTTLASAIAGIATGDTIEILDSEIYSENFPNNITISDITFTSSNDNPNTFPTIEILNDIYEYRNWWLNSASNVTFEKLKLKEFQIGYLVNNNKYLTISKCCIEFLTNINNLIEVANYNTTDAINVTNSIFYMDRNTNAMLFLNNNQNQSTNLATFINNTFYGSSTMYPFDSSGTNNNDIIILTNNIFYQMVDFGDSFINTANSYNNYLDDVMVNFIANTTNPQEYGSNNPFVSVTFSDCTDFQLSTNMNVTYLAEAPVDDVSSNVRSLIAVSAGAWEFMTQSTINRFRIHVT